MSDPWLNVPVRSIPMIVGTLVALAPSQVLRPIAGDEWEIGVIRLAAALAVGVGALWPWARHNAAWQVRAVAVAGWVLIGVYAVSGSEVSLVTAFCMITAVAVNLAVGRSFAASDDFRRRLEEGR